MPSTLPPPSKRGRPKKSPVDSLRVRAWFEAVRSISGLPTAYAVEKSLHPESFHRERGWVSRPMRWDRYKAGDVVPEQELVAYAETVYPGAAEWLHHPLWKALLPHPRTQAEINDEMRTLGGVINFSMFRPQPDYSQPERFPYTEQMVGMLSQLGTIDALAAAILLVHESATISSQPLHILALQTYRELQPAIAAHPFLHRLHPDLFSYIDLQYPEWVFTSPNYRTRTVVFWESYRDKFWPAEEAQKSRDLCEKQDEKKAEKILRAHFAKADKTKKNGQGRED